MPMRGLQGDKWAQEALEAFCRGKLRNLDKLINELLPWKVLPREFKPKALIFEAEAAKRPYNRLLKGDESGAMDWFRALPNAIGKVNLYNNEFVTHMGIGCTHEIKGGKMVAVALIRGVGITDPWAWEYLFDASKEDRAGLKTGSHELKVENTGWVWCIGWTELLVEFEDEDDPRSYTSIKLGTHHECEEVIAASEPFHRVRCKECHDALEDYRASTFRQFRGPSKRRKSASKGKTEKAINDLLALLED